MQKMSSQLILPEIENVPPLQGNKHQATLLTPIQASCWIHAFEPGILQKHLFHKWWHQSCDSDTSDHPHVCQSLQFSTHPSSHLQSHYFSFLVRTMLSCNPQLSLSISNRINHSHELFFVFPPIPLCFEIFLYLTVNLNKVLHSHVISNAFTNLLC